MDSHSALRAILRIKSGLSPFDRVSDLTVDLPGQLAILKQIHAQVHRGSGPALVVGPYGAGKTHFLQLAKEFSLQQGLVFGQLSQDTGLASLGHPQRHVSALIRSFTAPSPYGNLIDWLGNALEIPKHLNDFTALLQNLRQDQPEHSGIVNDILTALRFRTEYRTTAVVEILSGTLLTGKTAHSGARAKAYNLLQFWISLCQRMFRCKGAVLLFDELENLFTSAVCWNILSRRAAYRTLSFYSTGLFPTTAIWTLTPDGYNRLIYELTHEGQFLINSTSRLTLEDIQTLFEKVKKAKPFEISPLRPEDYLKLGQRLTSLHAEARGYSGLQTIKLPHSSPGMTPRIFLKSVVSLLESQWFQSRHF